MSFKPEIETMNDKGKFYDNSLAFATPEEAEFWAKDLLNRWLLAVNYRVVGSNEPVNYQINLETGVMSNVENRSKEEG